MVYEESNKLVYLNDGTAFILSSTAHSLLPRRVQDKEGGLGTEARMRKPPTKFTTLLTEGTLMAKDMGCQVT